MAKFKIGQKVRFIQEPAKTKFIVIAEIQEITCSAGTQVFYTGRLWLPNSRYSAAANAMVCTKELWKANEIELAPMKVEKAKKPKK